MKATYTINSEKNGIEIKFSGKPETATLDTLKSEGFRWHRVKMIWYAKNTPERLTLAERLADGQQAATESHTPAPAPVVDRINLDNLGTAKLDSYHDTNIAAAIRAEFKARGVKGATVRCGRGGYTASLTITVKATDADFVSVEEYKTRYTFAEFSCDAQGHHGVYDGSRWIYAATWETMSEEERTTAYDNHIRYYLMKAPDFYRYNQERKDYPTITTAFYEKLVAIWKIANQWNYDNSDPMTDYFDVGYYLDIDVKADAGREIRETMTDAERTAYNEEKAAEEAQRAAELEEYKRQCEESEKAYRAAEEARQAAHETVIAGSTAKDNEPLYITALTGGIGKECTIDELHETIREHDIEKWDAVINRRVDMTAEAYQAFCILFLDCFDFLAGKGGTASEDVRLEPIESIYKLNKAQRETIKWYICEAVGIYVNDELKLVCDPSGHNYSRYTYIPTEETTIAPAAPILKAQEEESRTKEPFYMPEDVTKQAENIHIGQKITIYQTDGWILNNVYAGFGTVTNTYPGTWAQYNGQYIELSRSGKIYKVFIRNDKMCLIYEGIKPLLPESVTSEKVSDTMRHLFNYDELIPRIYNYYKEQGQTPIVDTWQR